MELFWQEGKEDDRPSVKGKQQLEPESQSNIIIVFKGKSHSTGVSMSRVDVGLRRLQFISRSTKDFHTLDQEGSERNQLNSTLPKPPDIEWITFL